MGWQGRERLVGISTASVLLCMLGAEQARAQATGQVQVSSGGSGSSRLDSLQQLLLSPPDPTLNIFALIEAQREEFEAYREDAFLPNLGGGETVPGGVAVPEFDVGSVSLSVGADYLFPTGILVGASLDYTRADFDFDSPSPASVQQRLLDVTMIEDPAFVAAGGLGSPVDREFDEYGATVAVGYLAGPWTFLGAASYSRREIETSRREFNSALQFFQNDADFDSDNYSVDLGAAYRFDVAEGSIQPQVSIGYRREEVDGYTEQAGRQFEDDPTSPFVTGDFVAIARDDPLFQEDQDTRRTFNDQTIESIPLTVGLLFGYPLADPAATPPMFGILNIRTGVSYTHDFEDQKRTVSGTSENFPILSTEFQEENRNRDFMTLTGSLDFRLFGLRGAFTYEHDIGFDEREEADRVRFQLRTPL